MIDIGRLIEIDTTLLHVFNGSNSLFADALMMTYTMTISWMLLFAVLVFMVIKNNETLWQIFVVFLFGCLCFALSEYVSEGLIKNMVARPRPFNNEVIENSIDLVNDYRPQGFSFVSAHASNTISIAVFIALLVRSRLLSISLIVWSLINCYTRIYLGVHYPGDVLCGLLCGIMVGLVTYFVFNRVFKHVSNNPRYISSQYTKTGYLHSDVDIVVLVLVVSLIGGLVFANIVSI